MPTDSERLAEISVLLQILVEMAARAQGLPKLTAKELLDKELKAS